MQGSGTKSVLFDSRIGNFSLAILDFSLPAQQGVGGLSGQCSVLGKVSATLQHGSDYYYYILVTSEE